MSSLKHKLFPRETWERNLYILFAAQLLSVVGFSVIFPFLPLYVEELGVSTGGSVAFWSGMVFSAQAFTMAVMAPIWGTLSDRMGRKLMLERALFGGAILLTLMGFVRSAEELTLLRAIQGAVTGVITAANALVAASAPRKRAGWALGLMQTSVWAGAAVGPLLGGVLADLIGFAATFRVTGLLLLLPGLAVHRWVVEEHVPQPRAERPSMLAAWRRTLHSEGISALYGIKFVVHLAGAVMLPVAPLLVAQLMTGSDRIATMAGLFTAATAAASTFSAVRFGSLGDRVGHRTLLVMGCVASGVGYLFILGVGTIWQMIALAAVIGIANGAVVPNLGALLAHASPRGEQGTTFGIDASVNSLARMIAPLVGTTVAAWFTLQSAFAVAGAMFLVAAGLAALWVPRPQPRALEQPVGAGD